MARLEKPGSGLASLQRRTVLAGALALAACDGRTPMTVSDSPPIDMEALNAAMAQIARRAAPAALGVGLANLESGQVYTYAGDRRFPLQSVFKLFLAAAALSEVDARRLSLEERLVLEEKDLSPSVSPIAEAWPLRKDFTVGELLHDAVVVSDNTAADVLMRRIGGPGVVTAWLNAKRVREVRVDRYERELQPEIYGMASFRPEWVGEGFGRARQTVPPDRRLAAMRAYLADPRDTATPRGTIEFLEMLDKGELLSEVSTRRLLELMARARNGEARLKAGLPKDAVLFHKPGTSGADLGLRPVVNDVGIFTLADKRAYALAVFLAGAGEDLAAAEGILASVARACVAHVG